MKNSQSNWCRIKMVRSRWATEKKRSKNQIKRNNGRWEERKGERESRKSDKKVLREKIVCGQKFFYEGDFTFLIVWYRYLLMKSLHVCDIQRGNGIEENRYTHSHSTHILPYGNFQWIHQRVEKRINKRGFQAFNAVHNKLMFHIDFPLNWKRKINRGRKGTKLHKEQKHTHENQNHCENKCWELKPSIGCCKRCTLTFIVVRFDQRIKKRLKQKKRAAHQSLEFATNWTYKAPFLHANKHFEHAQKQLEKMVKFSPWIGAAASSVPCTRLVYY